MNFALTIGEFCIKKLKNDDLNANVQEAGSVAMWDNRACLHYGAPDFWPHTRHMERLCVLDFEEARKAPVFQPLPGARL